MNKCAERVASRAPVNFQSRSPCKRPLENAGKQLLKTQAANKPAREKILGINTKGLDGYLGKNQKRSSKEVLFVLVKSSHAGSLKTPNDPNAFAR